jgi:hypothetical protein
MPAEQGRKTSGGDVALFPERVVEAGVDLVKQFRPEFTDKY